MPKRKTTIHPQDVYPVYDTHDTFAEGGHKIHLMDGNTGKCLCGYNAFLHNEADMTYFKNNIISYISQPDPDGNLCKRCKEILINHVEI